MQRRPNTWCVWIPKCDNLLFSLFICYSKLNIRGFWTAPLLHSDRWQFNQRQKDYIPHTRTPPPPPTHPKHKTKQKGNTHLPHWSRFTSTLQLLSLFSLNPLLLCMTVSLLIISSCPHLPHSPITLHRLALACTQRGNPVRLNHPPWPTESNKPQRLNATGESQPTEDLSQLQSVWVCEEHLFDMSQK